MEKNKEKQTEDVWEALKEYIMEVVKSIFGDLTPSEKSYKLALDFEEFYMNGGGKEYNHSDVIDHALFREYIKWLGIRLPALIAQQMEEMGIPKLLKDLQDGVKSNKEAIEELNKCCEEVGKDIGRWCWFVGR